MRFKKFWRSLWTFVGTKITATAAWNPQADPAERANRQVQEALRAAVATVGSYDEWDKELPHICFGLNTQVSSVTGISPFELLHGFAARTPISFGSSSVNRGKQERAAYDMALENANRYKAAADRAAAEQARVGRILAGRRLPATVKVGDWVWMDGAHVPDQIPHKLAMRWYGPYEVLEVFAGGGTVRSRLPEELGRISTVVNIRRLKFSELRDAELSTEEDRLVAWWLRSGVGLTLAFQWLAVFRPLVFSSLRYQERRVCCLEPFWAQGREGGREGERESFIRNRGDGRVAGTCHQVCESKPATVCCCHCVGRVLAVTSSNKGSGLLRVFRVETHRDAFMLDGSHPLRVFRVETHRDAFILDGSQVS
jgi:hypothetical protein